MRKTIFSVMTACALFTASFTNAQTETQSSSKTVKTAKAETAKPGGKTVKTTTKEVKKTKEKSAPEKAK
jgi:hypothetical protein